MNSLLTTAALLPLVFCQLDDDTSLHFSDIQHGRLLWIIENISLPWIGSYEFLRSQVTSQTILLTVVDSSTGQTLGECSEISNEATRWTLFQWILKSDDRGPVCIRDLRVHDERSTGCPPHLIGNSFKSQFFNCSCPFEVDNEDFVSNDPQFPLFELAGTQAPSQTSPLSLSTLRPCDNFECLNNGSCVINERGSAECLCQNGFIGIACEVDLCSRLLCRNDGQCRVNGGEAYCECPPTFTGVLCETVIATCDPPCMNGKCVMENEMTRCECDRGFIGTICNFVDVCLKDAVCGMFGLHAKCVVDESSFITTSSMIYNATYKCECPHPISREFVDCLSLHLPTTVSQSVSSASPSGMMSTAEMVDITSPMSNADTTILQHEISDSVLVTTISSLSSERKWDSHSSSISMGPTVFAPTSTNTPKFSTISDSEFFNTVSVNTTDVTQSSIISSIHPNTQSVLPVRLETLPEGFRTTGYSPTFATSTTESPSEATSSMSTSGYRSFLTTFTVHSTDGTTSASPHFPAFVTPQSTVPFWMTATVHSSESHIEREEENNRNGLRWIPA
ncbi:hypothetical protein KIN20_037518 [Parelaphostrongylus tenuis]|uniref:EGF-like domain-containing protein n=1 Tax=Parelaphostrongylus tenuis TaxID=148309 RepID=A0AAD5REK9_PARTN|nr:hypothetical protein KIN20_037518 [Parelaphostrongylus tenuis]